MGAMDAISGHTKTIGLIGMPVSHSFSPAMHNHAFEALELDCLYLVYGVASEREVGAAVAGMKALGFAGFQVTMPYKASVVPYLDELTPAVELIGAAPTVVLREGRAIGYNTDGVGFMNNLKRGGVPIEGATMTLVGPGGAGSAIMVQAALDGVARLHVFARGGGKSFTHAKGLVGDVTARTGCAIDVLPLEDEETLGRCIVESSILANGSNVGMGADCTDTPVPARLLHSGLVVADAIYLPLKTQLLRDAEAVGAQVFGGLGMLIEQAVEAERIWFGVDATGPITEMAATLAH